MPSSYTTEPMMAGGVPGMIAAGAGMAADQRHQVGRLGLQGQRDIRCGASGRQGGRIDVSSNDRSGRFDQGRFDQDRGGL